MLVMEKPPKRKANAPPKRVHKGTNINVWLPDELVTAFEELRKTTRMSKTTQVEVAFELLLKQAGLWPPK